MLKGKTALQPATLSEAIGFSNLDLLANRVGDLSERQLRALTHKKAEAHGAFIGAIFLVTAAAYFIVQAIQYDGLQSFRGTHICGGIFSAVFLVGAFMQWRSYITDLDTIVRQIEGDAHLEIKGSALWAQYFVSIGNLEFKIDRPTFFAFKQSENYRIYYAPGSNTILSAEWLRGE